MTEGIGSVEGLGSVALLAGPRTVLVADLGTSGPPRLLSSLSLPGAIASVDLDVSLAAILVRSPVSGAPEIHVADLSRPRFPAVSVIATLDDLAAHALAGTTLLAVAPGSIHLVDVSSPIEPSSLGRVEIPCPAPLQAAASGSSVAVACGDAGVVVVEFPDPLHPTVFFSGHDRVDRVLGARGRWLLLGAPGDRPSLLTRSEKGDPTVEKIPVDIASADVLDFDGERIASAEQGGVRVRTLGPDPGFRIEGTAIACDLAGGSAYVLIGDPAGAPRLEVLRVDDSKAPPVTLSLSPFAHPVAWAVRGRWIAVAGREGGVMIIDARDPSAPLVDYAFEHGARPIDIAWTADDEIAIADESGAIVFHCFAGRPARTVQRTLELPGALAVDMEPTGLGLAVADAAGALHVVLHAGHDQPFVADSIPLASPSSIEAIAGDVMIVSSGGASQTVPLDTDGSPVGPASDKWQSSPPVVTDGKHVFDAPGGSIRARLLASGVPDGEPAILDGIAPEAMAWHRGRLWALGDAGLVVASVGDGGTLRYEHATGPLGIETAGADLASIDGGVALLAGGSVLAAESSLPPVDVVSRETLPQPSHAAASTAQGTLLGGDGSIWLAGGAAIEVPGTVRAIRARPGGALACMGEDGLAVVGIAGDGSLGDAIPVAIPGGASDAAHAGSAACVAAGTGGLVVVDLSDPAHPRVAEAITEGGNITHVAARGLVCYGLDAEIGVLAVRVVDPASPVVLGTLVASEPLAASGLWAAGGQIAVASGRRIQLIEVEDPPAASVAASIVLDGPIKAFVRDGHLAAAVGARTWILDLSGPEPELAGSLGTLCDPAGTILEGARLACTGSGALWTMDLSCLEGESK